MVFIQIGWKAYSCDFFFLQIYEANYYEGYVIFKLSNKSTKLT